MAFLTLKKDLCGDYSGLRARGAFLLSGSMSVDGAIGNITVHSEKGQTFVWLDVGSGAPRANYTALPASSVAAPLPTVWQIAGAGGDEVPVVVTEVNFAKDEAFLAKGERALSFQTGSNGTYVIVPPPHASLSSHRFQRR